MTEEKKKVAVLVSRNDTLAATFRQTFPAAEQIELRALADTPRRGPVLSDADREAICAMPQAELEKQRRAYKEFAFLAIYSESRSLEQERIVATFVAMTEELIRRKQPVVRDVVLPLVKRTVRVNAHGELIVEAKEKP